MSFHLPHSRRSKTPPSSPPSTMCLASGRPCRTLSPRATSPWSWSSRRSRCTRGTRSTTRSGLPRSSCAYANPKPPRSSSRAARWWSQASLITHLSPYVTAHFFLYHRILRLKFVNQALSLRSRRATRRATSGEHHAAGWLPGGAVAALPSGEGGACARTPLSRTPLSRNPQPAAVCLTVRTSEVAGAGERRSRMTMVAGCSSTAAAAPRSSWPVPYAETFRGAPASSAVRRRSSPGCAGAS